MAKMRAVQVSKAGGKLEMMERELPEPRPGTVRVKVQACGICHSDSVTVEGCSRGFSILGCRGTRSSEWWTRSATG